MPSNHPAVKLFVVVHCRKLHAGVEHALSVLRQRFWSVKERSTDRPTLQNCLLCRHYQTKPFWQRMAPLLEDRIKAKPPFSNVGLNLAGPLYLKGSGDKAYMCLFTCAVSYPCGTLRVSVQHDRRAIPPCFETLDCKKRNVQRHLVR